MAREFFSFYGYRFCEIAGFIDVATAKDGSIICQKLKNHSRNGRDKKLIYIGKR